MNRFHNNPLARLLRRFGADRSGSVAIIAAFTLPLLVGAVALVGEYGTALLSKAENQRISDLAAYAGALAYIETSSEEQMVIAARRIAQLNGIDPAGVTVALVASPRTVGASAVDVHITTSNSLFLSQVLGTGPTVDSAAQSFAEVGSAGSAPPPPEEAVPGGCILALSASGSGITLSGGTSITAPSCFVSSNNTVTVPCGTVIKALQVNYNSSSAPSQPCSGIQKPDGTTPGNVTKVATPDPLAGNSAVVAATAHIASVLALTAPAAPEAPSLGTAPTGGVTIAFGWDENGTKNQAIAAGCTASLNGGSNTWTLSCPAGNSYTFSSFSSGRNLAVTTTGTGATSFNFSGAVSIGGGQTWTFGSATYNFGGNFTNSGTLSFAGGNLNFFGNFTHSGPSTTFPASALTVAGNLALSSYGTATLNSTSLHVGGLMSVTGSVAATAAATSVRIRQGLKTEGSASLTFSAATSVRIGATAASCAWDAGTVSICQSGTTLTFSGAADFQLSSGVYLSGGVTMNMGASNGNTFHFGPSSTGAAIKIGGGSKLLMGNARTGLFRMVGNIDGGGGGSCLVLPAAPEHDILGNFTAAGAIWLGDGTYTITGYFWMGASNGGSSTCNGETISVRGDSVTLVIKGNSVPSSGNCANRAFCVGAGYSNIVLSAPTSGPYTDLVVLGPQESSITAGILFKEGASGGKLSGAVYFPYGPLRMEGGAGATGGTKCLQLVATLITLTGGTSTASECAVGVDPSGSGSGSGSGEVVIIAATRPTLVQ